MKINDLLKAFGSLQNDDGSQTFDLTTKEGYKGFKNAIKELRESDSSVFDMFGIDIDEWLDSIEELGESLHNVNKDRKEIIKDAVKQMDCKVIDHSGEEEEPEDEQKKEECEFKRPSELLTINQKLQLHKLVQEYVDTAIKPFNKGILSNDQINDAYAGLYEFAAWILNK